MKVKNFLEYNLQNDMLNDFLNSFNSYIKESESNNKDYNSVLKKVVSDLKLNINLISTFGFGIGAMCPIVENLMKNKNISSIDLSLQTIVLLTATSISIIYLEEKKKGNKLTKDIKSMLEELKLKGVGNGIVKKVINSIKSIKNIFFLIAKKISHAINGVIDMFAYTAFLLPILNGVNFIIGKYDLNIDTLPENFIGLSMGLVTLIAKYGITDIVKRIKGKFNKKEIIDDQELDDIESPIKNFSTFIDKDYKQSGDLINEQ